MSEAKLQPCVPPCGVPSGDPDHTDRSTADARELTRALKGGSLPDGTVFNRGGATFANSRDVAAVFGKRHDNVLRDIDTLRNGSSNLRTHSWFIETTSPVAGARGGSALQHVRSFDMTRDGFSLLAMGFTGKKALHWKCLFIEAFNEMEAALRAAASSPAAPLPLDDPDALRATLLAINTALLAYMDKIDKLEVRNAVLAPKAAALDQLSAATGSLTITAAAKTLGVPPGTLFDWLDGNGWTYRQGKGPRLAYESRLKRGLLEHVEHRIAAPGGGERLTTQVRITAKGMARLGEIFSQHGLPLALAAPRGRA
jgi:Rha family phage regulatory protein